jgi:hypothetical protein
MPFIWASKRIFHIHDSLLTFPQASPIKNEIWVRDCLNEITSTNQSI